jgi:hypothetical protein
MVLFHTENHVPNWIHLVGFQQIFLLIAVFILSLWLLAGGGLGLCFIALALVLRGEEKGMFVE